VGSGIDLDLSWHVGIGEGLAQGVLGVGVALVVVLGDGDQEVALQT
jgi:hypothetical protein